MQNVARRAKLQSNDGVLVLFIRNERSSSSNIISDAT